MICGILCLKINVTEDVINTCDSLSSEEMIQEIRSQVVTEDVFIMPCVIGCASFVM